jgi:sec-independent protein translocase protein TatC
MAINNNQHPDPDDFFSDTRMSFGDHLEDLRIHLWRAIGGFLIALFASFFIGDKVLHFIAAPVVSELGKYWDEYYTNKHDEILRDFKQGNLNGGQPIHTEILIDVRPLREQPGMKKDGPQPLLDVLPLAHRILENLEIGDWIDAKHGGGAHWVKVPIQIENPLLLFNESKQFEKLFKRPGLSTLNVQEAFMVYLKVCMVTGFVLASPWIFIQIWGFVAAGLYPQEKSYVNTFLPISIGLFLIGVVMCEFLVIPRAVNALLWFNKWLELEPEFRLNEWLGFAILMPLVFGVSFQTPLVMFFLERIGVMTVEAYRARRRIAWFALAVFAMIITPTPDAVTMLCLWIPMSLLYELGILICQYAPKRPTFDMDVPESEELIEV